MNKKGHVALSVAAGTAALFLVPSLDMHANLGAAAAFVAAAGIGGLAPDLDHKTSTMSKHIQFSARHRRFLKTISGIFGVIGIGFMLLQQFGDVPAAWGTLTKSGPLWIGAFVLLGLMARSRSFVLMGAGAMLLAAYAMYDLHWIAAFAGFSFLILPLVKHRGLIHSPEFAAVLFLGLISFSAQQPDMVEALSIGFVIGWCAHLIGDMFGSEGIHSLLLPQLSVALHLFRNGGQAERYVSRFCWSCSFLIWGLWLLQTGMPYSSATIDQLHNTIVIPSDLFRKISRLWAT